MRFIGITGGVGAGKSAILSYLAEKPKTKVMLADEIAHKLMEPGTECYQEIVKRFEGEDIFSCANKPSGYSGKGYYDGISAEGEAEKDRDKSITHSRECRPFDRIKLAQVIFGDPVKREAMNAIVHPAVKAYVRQEYEIECKKDELELLILEAALLIEEEYDEICDELWYIYTSEENRRIRLRESRGYSDEKIDYIFKSQLSEQEFRESTQITIDNNGDLVKTYQQIERALRRKADE